MATCRHESTEMKPPAEGCPVERIPRRQEIADNLPYAAMILLGSAILWLSTGHPLWRWVWAGLYLLYGAGGAMWIMLFVCPYCHFHGPSLCPCGYGRIASRFRAKKDGALFHQKFRRHIPVIAPLWFLPVPAAAFHLLGHFSWAVLGLLIAFAANSYVVLPLVSRRYGCARCPQKSDCPWMSR